MTTKLEKILAKIETRDNSRISKRGRTPMADGEKRNKCVSVRLNESEIELVDFARGRLQRGEFLRVAAIDELPKVIPEINREAYSELSKLASNLNQVAKALNSNESIESIECSALLKKLRNLLIGLTK